MKTSDLLKRFIPKTQYKVLANYLRGEEKEHFKDVLSKLKQTILNAPVTYDQEEAGEDAVIHLHYFSGGCDWYITEIDTNAQTEQLQAFGLVNLGHGLELGYISIKELLEIQEVEIDLYWKQTTIKEIKKAAV